MKHILALATTIAATALCVPHISYANTEDAELDNLLNMDIEDLMHVSVSIASKRKESLYDAPGIISVLTEKISNVLVQIT